jgi:hypothetical protein
MLFLAWEDYHKLPWCLGTILFFWEADFHKIKSKEVLSRTHGLRTADENTGLTDSFWINWTV